MTHRLDRRTFTATAAGLLVAVPASAWSSARGAQEGEPASPEPADDVPRPREAQFARDYDPPGFQPGWKREQINRTLVQDFVIFAHSDPEMTKTLLDREPMLVNAAMDWGGGDWETGLGGASHMGRKDIVELLLARGARMDLFCATMMGMLDVVKAMLTLQPALIDAPGPHGFNLHFHAQVGLEQAKPVLDYLQSVKEIELRPNPIAERLREAAEKQAAGGTGGEAAGDDGDDG